MMSPKQERRTTARLIVANVQAADAPQSRSNVNAHLHAKPTIIEPTQRTGRRCKRCITHGADSGPAKRNNEEQGTGNSTRT
jgi:hypothetical protein